MLTWRHACANLSRQQYEDSLAASAGSKAAFFGLTAKASQPLNLMHTLRADTSPSTALVTAPLAFAFVGDSIARDLHYAWHALAPRGLSWLVSQDRTSVVRPAKPYVEDAIASLRNGSIDALFVTMGLHCVLREGNKIGSRPWTEQFELRRKNVARMAEEAEASGRPVVLVSVPPLDGEVMMLDPAKKDFDGFHDLSLLHLQAPHLTAAAVTGTAPV